MRLSNASLLKTNAETRFEVLKNQVNPHFLFNSLNTINSLIVTDQQAAVNYVNNMSDVYRYVLESHEHNSITLEEELRFIKAYTHMLKGRYGNKMHIKCNIHSLYSQYRLPPMALQILIENAVKHNIASHNKPLHIHIYTNDNHMLVVENNLQNDQYAIRAFEVNSIDYLLKPVRIERLQQAIDKFQRLTSRGPMAFNQQQLQHITHEITKAIAYKRHFLIPFKDRLIPVQADEFAWFEIKSGVVRGITFDKKHWQLKETLDELTESLNPESFYRANRQFLVSRKAIKGVEYYFNGRFCLHMMPIPEEPVLISKAKAGRFRLWMAG